MCFSGNCNRMCTHPSTNVILESNNQINGWTEDREGRNKRHIMNRGKEWKNRKERGRFVDNWYCCLLVITVSQSF